MARQYADAYRGWPVAPRKRQHPIRGSFLDPRPKGKYHHGVDVSVRDDKPEAGAPAGRAHRVYAVEGGRVWGLNPARGLKDDGFVRIGHFGYGHVEPIVQLGEQVRPGQLVAWTIKGQWHVHLSEWRFAGGDHRRRTPVNPLNRAGKLAPYVDLFPPVIREIRFTTQSSPPWTGSLGRAVFPDGGLPINPERLFGLVDVRARIEDPQSFGAWFSGVSVLETAHHPVRVHLTVVRLADGKKIIDRDVFRCDDVTLGPEASRPVPLSFHYAPGTRQNLRAQTAVKLQRPGQGQLWFRLFARPQGAYWDTTLERNGRYRLKISAWDIVGNRDTDSVVVGVRN